MTRRHAALALALAASLAVPAAGLAQTKTFDRTVDLEAGASLTLVSNKGSVHLTPWDKDQIEIHARIEAPDDVSADYAKRAVDATEIEVSGDRRSLRIAPNYDKVPTESRWGWSESRTVPPVHFEIRAPRRLELRLDLDRTETHVGAFDGRFDAEADRSDVMVDGFSGRFRLNVDRGDRVELAGLSGSANVTADRSDVRLTFAKLDDDSRVEIDRGALEVRLGAGQGTELRADIERRADFESDFPITTRGRVGDRIEGTINGGGPQLTLHSERARVRLRKGL